jgi:predicted AAA+ superfamily ATPase
MIQRHLERPIAEALQEFPVVLLVGARQVGKTTLVRAVSSGPWKSDYYSLDDRSILDAALSDPDGFIRGNPSPMVIDEVQRAPDLMRAVKLEVDKDRKPGMYLLTGSANPLRLKSVHETLAGRMAVFQLDTFSWAEIEGRQAPTEVIVDLLECDSAADFLSRLRKKEVKTRSDDIKRLIISGCYPDPERMKSRAARDRWFDSYRQTYLERDVKEVTSVADLPLFGRLLRTVALRTGNLLNLLDISRELGIPYTAAVRGPAGDDVSDRVPATLLCEYREAPCQDAQDLLQRHGDDVPSRGLYGMGRARESGIVGQDAGNMDLGGDTQDSTADGRLGGADVLEGAARQ